MSAHSATSNTTLASSNPTLPPVPLTNAPTNQILLQHTLNDAFYEHVLRHVIGLDQEKLELFLKHVPDVNTLKFFAPKEIKDLWNIKGFKTWEIVEKMRIRTWKEWLMNNPGKEHTFTASILHQELTNRAQSLCERPPNPVSTQVPKLERPKPFDGCPEHWKGWKRLVVTYFFMLKTPQGIPYAYIIAGITRTGDDDLSVLSTLPPRVIPDPTMDPTFVAHAKALRTQPAFHINKQEMFLELKVLCNRNIVYQRIRPFEAQADVRGAWKALLHLYEGDAATQSMINRATQTYMTTTYDQDTKMDLDCFIHKYDEAFTDLTGKGVLVEEIQKITFFLNNIADPHYAHLVEATKIQVIL